MGHLFFEDLQKKAPALKALPKISDPLGPGDVQTICSVQVYHAHKKSRRVKECWQFSIWDVFIRYLVVLFSSPAPPGVCFMGRMWWKGCFICLAVSYFPPGAHSLRDVVNSQGEGGAVVAIDFVPFAKASRPAWVLYWMRVPITFLLSCVEMNSVMKGQLNALGPLVFAGV